MSSKPELRIDCGAPLTPLNDLFGIFFEDLNHAADGGLYAELVQNRSFEFDPIDHPSYHSLTAWEKLERGGQVELAVENVEPLNRRNPHYAVLELKGPGAGGLLNAGFNSGIPVREGEQYRFSFYARREGALGERVTVSLESAAGEVYAQAQIAVAGAGWEKYETVLEANATDFSGRLAIVAEGEGRLYLDMVSLFPVNTFLGRENGMRADIAQLLADMRPKFMRFPGGCLIHDGSLNAEDRDSMYRWKNTLGDVAQRPARRNNWRYNQTLGLGYYEYFLFCEDIGAKPLPVLPAGYDPHHQAAVPLDELGPWIDDALDLIEFANGAADTEWGAVRASLGHPEPFGLEYLAIGNEEVGEAFFERYKYFHEAIRERYPEIKIINSSGPFAAGSEYDRGWKSARENGSDLVDEHYYQSPEWFLANMDRYDSFKADEPKVFLGEYATWGNTYYNALVEAAFMTRLERNAHAVGLACYAPMLCNADYVNWKPDMIWFNNHQAYGTANYYVQKLFMNHQGDELLGVAADGLGQPEKPEDKPVSGGLALVTDQADMMFSRISLTNDNTGEVLELDHLCGRLSNLPGAQAEGLSGTLDLGETGWSAYTLRLTCRKLAGRKGFVIRFGKTDADNFLYWEVGGWQNQDSIIGARVNGRSSCLAQNIFTLETQKDYELVLEVRGRKIRSYMNGQPDHETEDRLPSVEPLYLTASREHGTGDVIVKAVNVREQAVSTRVVLDGFGGKPAVAQVYELAGYALAAENSFAEPELIKPREHRFDVQEGCFDYKFPGQSVTVFRIHR
ncbi:alpha-L-arabinofuranosidase C-terminal domain-containing protein [Paenibacillus sp. YN15]|uniref:alpha-L-arabinofuranosidase C-terminal domain-containing protein n=1 Tax=Paenibacillus sp. YN15 TaxID=1742774 RepID=UPI000DCEB0F7|nr:alpha-L-arabinofuranosidase C-terminal domain-containing protein [Paenibacillus sp. YN15]RAV05618.1 alpha-L-arabinofuranosidase [Paenibacillus sp. YN15]